MALPQKEPKTLAPSSGPALRAGCLRSIAAPRVRHEWAVHGPVMPCAASLRLTPLHVDSAQPDERGDSRRLRGRVGQGAWFFVGGITAQPGGLGGLPILKETVRRAGAQVPLRPAERRRCAGGEGPGWPREAGLGQGWPMPAGPRSGAGARGVWPRSGQTRMSGRAFSLVTFSLRGQRESDSAGGPKPVTARHADNGPYTKSPNQASPGPRWASRRSAPTYAEGAHRSGRKAPGVGGAHS